MPKPDNSLAEEMSRNVARSCNNEAWALIERDALSAEELATLITLAATARHHWYRVGTQGNKVHADLLCAWAMARAGASDPAVYLADQVVSHFDRNGADWERAFAHAALAAAFAAAGDRIGFEKHVDTAAKLAARLSGPDASYFEAAFRTLPKSL